MKDPVLAEHGTHAFALKPSSILHAAAADIATRDRAKKNPAGRRYLFIWWHVKEAKSPADLIRRALADSGAGAGHPDHNTRMIYRDSDLLRAAYELAMEGRSGA